MITESRREYMRAWHRARRVAEQKRWGNRRCGGCLKCARCRRIAARKEAIFALPLDRCPVWARHLIDPVKQAYFAELAWIWRVKMGAMKKMERRK
jgi:hypothetical protein